MNYSQNLLKMKKRSKKGFTLMEMLIVVAIIAILVAVSIPVFAGQLENAREQTDAANMRAAKAVAITQYLTDGKTITDQFYDATKGEIVLNKPANGYGQGTTAGKDSVSHVDMIIKVSVNPTTGVFTGTWVTK